jgi:hypothetical protein
MGGESTGGRAVGAEPAKQDFRDAIDPNPGQWAGVRTFMEVTISALQPEGFREQLV